MSKWIRAALALATAATTAGCVATGKPDDHGAPSDAPSVSTDRLAAFQEFEPEQACELLGFDAVPPLGEAYDYQVLDPDPREGGCSQEVVRMTADEHVTRAVRVLASGITWEDDEEAAIAAFQDQAGPDASAFAVTEFEKAVQSDIYGDWDEGTLISVPEWESNLDFSIHVREGAVVLQYRISVPYIRPDYTECTQAMIEGCVIGYGIVSDWIENELLPEALANLQEAGYVDP